MSESADKKGTEMRLLITGGSGFIGTNAIIHYTARNCAVINVDIVPPLLESQQEFWRQQDILEETGLRSIFKEFCPTHVLHLAARTDLDETMDINGYAANIQGMQNVVDAIRLTPTVQRLIVASTQFVCEPGYRPRDVHDYRPHTLYGQSKVLTEKIVWEGGLECVWSIVRPALIWGPYHERLRHGFFSILRKGLYFHPGGRVAKRSYGYVGNSIFQLDRIFCAENEQVDRKVFYLADFPVDLLEWTDGFSRELLGHPVRCIPFFFMRAIALVGDLAVRMGYHNFPMTSFRLGNMTSDNIVDTDRINEVTGPLPFTMLDGVHDTATWLRSVNKKST